MPVFVVTLQDVIGLGLLGLILTAIAVYSLYVWIKQTLCKHKKVYEGIGLDAICSDCGKNLGFIGTWREKNERKN
jgi:hypothetical protein